MEQLDKIERIKAKEDKDNGSDLMTPCVVYNH